jgi:hypothetical protein
MARKQKRRPIRRRPVDRSEEVANRQRWTEAAARGLLGTNSLPQVRSELSDRQLLLDEADRAAQLDPNPANLARYRTARSQVEVAKRALEIAGDNTPEGP